MNIKQYSKSSQHLDDESIHIVNEKNSNQKKNIWNNYWNSSNTIRFFSQKAKINTIEQEWKMKNVYADPKITSILCECFYIFQAIWSKFKTK